MNTNFLNLSYWLSTRPNSLAPSMVKYFGFFLLVLFVLAFMAYLQSKKSKSLYNRCWSRVFNFGYVNLIIGLFLLFFAYEGVPFLSIRVVYLFWALGMIYWLVAIIKEFKKIPGIKARREKEAEYKKYIP